MSQANVELVRALADRWNAGVRSVPTASLHPAVELETPFSSVSGEPYRGYSGVQQWTRDIDEQFAEWRLRLEEVREAGDAVIAVGGVHGRGRASGIAVDFPVAALVCFAEDQRVVRLRIRLDVSAVLESVAPGK